MAPAKDICAWLVIIQGMPAGVEDCDSPFLHVDNHKDPI